MAQPQNFDDPVPVYRTTHKGLSETRSVHNQKEFNDALAEGFSPRYVFQEYPKGLYHDDGSLKTVYSKEEEEAALEEGWSLKPHPDQRHLDRPKVKAPGAPSEREAALEIENEELREANESQKERIDDLEAKFQKLLVEIRGKKKAAKPQADDDKAEDSVN